MKKTETSTQADRRGFLKLAGASLVGTGAVAATAVVPAAAAESAAAPDTGRYRESEHVKRYYELARFI